MNSKEVTPLQGLRYKKAKKKEKAINTPCPESKEEKLLRLKALFEQGLYNPDSKDIAEALITKLEVEREKNSRK